jgi:hypothetical protein
MEDLENQPMPEAFSRAPEVIPVAEDPSLASAETVGAEKIAQLIVRGVGAGIPSSEEEIANSVAIYEALRDSRDEAVKIGLYGEDLQRVLQNAHTVSVHYANPKGEAVQMPLLVPAAELKWYNMDLLRATYGYGKEYLYYAHPLIPNDEVSGEAIEKTLDRKLSEGAIIFTDQYLGDTDSNALNAIAENSQGKFSIESIGGGDVQRTGEVFVGPTTFTEAGEIKKAPSISEVYKQMIASGELATEIEDGVSLVDVIDGKEAERIWEIYQEPFDELSKEHPMYAGFSRDELMDILSDPEVAKMVNKVDGKISTLCFFVDNFDHCPWFNKTYYQERYPEYYDTDNVVIFPGIVTDPQMRGNDYAMQVIDLATQLYSRRGSDILVTFECTETSAIYIPTIVETAIGHSGKGKITGLEQPISVTEYKALRKVR